MDSTPQPPDAPLRPLLWIFLGSGLVLAFFVARFNFLTDDAYILFRYSRNFARGLGLVYNPGVEPPVEGYSEFLWAVLLGGIERLGWSIGFWSRALTIAGSGALLWLLLAFGRRRLGLSSTGLWAAGLFFATLPTVGIWTTGGLSSSLFALCIFWCYQALFSEPAAPRGVQAGLAGTLTCLLRADGPYWIATLLGLALLAFAWRRWLGAENNALVRRRFLRGFLTASVILVVLGALFLTWRVATYGDYLPNTARAKVGMSALSLERGAKYLLSFWAVMPATLLVFVFGVAGLGARLLRRAPDAFDAMGALVLTITATFGYGLLVGGDFMAMGRFFLPAAPLLALLFGVFVQRLGHLSRSAGLIVAGLCLASSVAPAFDMHVTTRAQRASVWFRWSTPDYLTEYEMWQGMRDRCQEWTLLGKALALHTTAEESLVLGPIGAIGYFTEMTILDLYGLTNREVLEASEPGTLRRSPGHDREVNIEFFDRYNPTWREVYLTGKDDVPEELLQYAEQVGFKVIALDEADGFPRNRGYLMMRYW